MKLIGTFSFRLTTNGNLCGEYFNNGSTNIDVESARRKSEIFGASATTAGAGFIGEYVSVWTEGNKVESATLKIEMNPRCSGAFSLSWRKKETPVFLGEGMVSGGELVGYYTAYE